MLDIRMATFKLSKVIQDEVLMRASFLFLAFPLLCSTLLAQDINLKATYGDVELTAGFTPDPYSATITAGGSISATPLGADCKGYIANAPDIQLNYQSATFPLIFSVGAIVDTSLVINLPNGSWLCDDDSGDGLNPMLKIMSPSSGIYDIYVGTIASSSSPSSVLYISEQAARYDTLSSSDINNDSFAFGDIVEGRLETGDFINSEGKFEDIWIFDGFADEFVYIELHSSDFDTYLIMESPSGQVYYNDDFEGDQNSSVLDVQILETGEYRVTVTSYRPGATGYYEMYLDIF